MLMENKKENNVKGLIFSIQSYSVHDGPGTRTTVFLNGCPLSCKWCCNPEGLFRNLVMLHSEAKCKKCSACIQACPHHAVSIGEEGRLVFERSVCDACDTRECVDVCLHEGNSVSGQYYTIEELIHRLNRDRPYWGDHGGVTFSGGEPLLQREFILPMLKECKKHYMHVCIETTACLNSAYWLEAIKYVDWIFTDIKHMDPDRHKEMVGVDNSLILKNIRLLAMEQDWQGIVVPRIPIIPGFNDDDENIIRTAEFVREIGLEVINILPFHRLGESKYRQLGQKYVFDEQESPTEERMKHLQSLIKSKDLLCYIGYKTPF